MWSNGQLSRRVGSYIREEDLIDSDTSKQLATLFGANCFTHTREMKERKRERDTWGGRFMDGADQTVCG